MPTIPLMSLFADPLLKKKEKKKLTLYFKNETELSPFTNFRS